MEKSCTRCVGFCTLFSPLFFVLQTRCDRPLAGIRTLNLLLRRQVLYPLSYSGKLLKTQLRGQCLFLIVGAAFCFGCKVPDGGLASSQLTLPVPCCKDSGNTTTLHCLWFLFVPEPGFCQLRKAQCCFRFVAIHGARHGHQSPVTCTRPLTDDERAPSVGDKEASLRQSIAMYFRVEILKKGYE